ncbi:hypothetical protein SAMN05444156_3040 [Verrucomicrobium sp. GAS474]|nr:hypothetical protein SAMN05444156_3040 [Verrucomicrobium sp. GAS474]
MSEERYRALRERHPSLTYEGFTAEEREGNLVCHFEFSLEEGPTFRPALSIPLPTEGGGVPSGALKALVFRIGLVELISYWKAACPPRVVLRAGKLGAEEAAWWRWVWFHGLGEFFYLNKIGAEIDTFLTLEQDAAAPDWPLLPASGGKGILVPIGGGKDSLVTLDLLRGHRDEVSCFLLGRTRAQAESVRLMGYGEAQVIQGRRAIAPELLELNRQGYLNGHTPFSAMLGYVTALTAALHGRRYIALSNESSASEPTVPGTEVNHQFSKGWEFERRFAAELGRIAPGISYFSLLRPWNELRIAERFARIPGALGVFRSCNVGSRDDRWCGKCPKCLFVDILLAPFVGRAERSAVFGGFPPLEEASLQPIFDELTGVAATKPFECVGEVGEVRAALALALEKGEAPVLVRDFASGHGEKLPSAEEAAGVLRFFNDRNGVPAHLLPLLT